MAEEFKQTHYSYSLPSWFYIAMLTTLFGVVAILVFLWAWYYSPFPRYTEIKNMGQSENMRVGSVIICLLAPLTGLKVMWWRRKIKPQLIITENALIVPSAILQRQTQIRYSEIISAKREVVGEAAALVIRSQKGKFSLLYDWMDSEEQAAQFEEALFKRVEAVKSVNH